MKKEGSVYCWYFTWSIQGKSSPKKKKEEKEKEKKRAEDESKKNPSKKT